ncbi:hypothetical protein V5799_026358 [Amblyomma americanum]|uniref:Uncharacterized protein n=1 Tax=Amblyomma americanum TaxID=6943 RepID=A0AAQ4DIT7_AMBAM
MSASGGNWETRRLRTCRCGRPPCRATRAGGKTPSEEGAWPPPCGTRPSPKRGPTIDHCGHVSAPSFAPPVPHWPGFPECCPPGPRGCTGCEALRPAARHSRSNRESSAVGSSKRDWNPPPRRVPSLSK